MRQDPEIRPPARPRDHVVGAALALLLACLVPSASSAQGVDIPSITAPDLASPPTVVLAQFGHQFKTDVEDPGTKVARNNAFFSIVHRIKISERTAIFPLVNYSVIGYDFSSNSGNAYQWDDTHRLVVGGLVSHDLNDRWRLIAAAVIRSWGETGASYGQAITGGMVGGFNYRPSETFSIGLLIGALSGLETDLALAPIPTMEWQFAERWNWHVGLVAVFGPGVGSEVTWQATKTVSFGTGFTYQNRRYRLRDKTRFVSSNGRTDDGGVGQEIAYPVFAVVKWNPTPKSALNLLAGVTFNGELRLESDDGGYIAQDSYDPSPFIGARGSIAF